MPNYVVDDFVFVGNSIKQIKVKNDIVNLPPKAQTSFSLDVDFSRPLEYDEEKKIRKGYLLLSVEVKVKIPGEKNKSKYNIDIEGCFRSAGEMPEKDFITRLAINGGAVLYSIARSLILDLSANTYFEGKISLPMVNMVRFIEEKLASSKGTSNDDQ